MTGSYSLRANVSTLPLLPAGGWGVIYRDCESYFFYKPAVGRCSIEVVQNTIDIHLLLTMYVRSKI